MARCMYHPETKLNSEGECPTCNKELMDYAAWRTGKSGSPKKGMGILKRSGALDKLL